MRTRFIASAISVLLTVACHPSARGTADGVEASAAASEPCAVSLDGVDVSHWQTVAATGFTFCAPPDWTRRGTTIRRGASVVRWGRGAPPPKVRESVIRVPAGSVPGGAGGLPDSEVRRFTEVIGGLPADVWRNRFGRDYYTGAEWTTTRIWLEGDARDGQAADLEVAIYRTVRFAAP